MFHGESVVLRRVEPADYPAIQRWQNEPDVFRWMDYERPFSLADIAAGEERAAREGHPFVIEAAGRPIGRIGLNQIREPHGVASLYLFIGEPDAWGKGFGLAALEVLLSYAFEHLGLRLVQLWTRADNERALRLYKTAGFREDGRLRDRSMVEGRPTDHVVMSVTHEEFEASRGR
ncbi:MAG: GNAT family N-acetyltransferase [Acidobacteria bacterium]|nr:GNAT family N-acetyltransferase [Acidobacteriota bacterium]